MARMLLSSIDTLAKTDITAEALARLAESQIRRVRVIGRRGPIQASFTIKETRELMNLENVGRGPFDEALLPRDVSGLGRPSKRLMELLIKHKSGTSAAQGQRTWSLDFCRAPREFVGNHSNAESQRPQVASTIFETVSLHDPMDPRSKTEPLGDRVEISSQLVLRSTGYRSIGLDGFKEANIEFDGTIRNDGLGRVSRHIHQGAKSHDDAAEVPVPGLYCSGWVKRGPTGVIASTMQDAFETAETVCRDWLTGVPFLPRGYSPSGGWDAVKSDSAAHNLGQVRVVSWQDWQRLNQVELQNGRAHGKPREKFTSAPEMLKLLE